MCGIVPERTGKDKPEPRRLPHAGHERTSLQHPSHAAWQPLHEGIRTLVNDIFLISTLHIDKGESTCANTK